MFEAKGVRAGYDGVEVIKGVDFSVCDEIFAILGANGAGKTTLLSAIAGLVQLTGGDISLNENQISGLPPWAIARKGIAYVPQENGVFADLTVMENLGIGAMLARRSQSHRLDELIDLFPDLAKLRNQKAGTLSGGQARMVAAGRALMQDPSLLLLDEPTAGLSPLYVDNFFDKIRQIHEARGVAIIVTEQNATKALEIADRVMILSLGEASTVVAAEDLTTQHLKEGYRI